MTSVEQQPGDSIAFNALWGSQRACGACGAAITERKGTKWTMHTIPHLFSRFRTQIQNAVDLEVFGFSCSRTQHQYPWDWINLGCFVCRMFSRI